MRLSSPRPFTEAGTPEDTWPVPLTSADVAELQALVSDLLTTLNRMEHRMTQLQADHRLFPYVRSAHGLGTTLAGELLAWQGRTTVAAMGREDARG